jgi:hypothetical protein
MNALQRNDMAVDAVLSNDRPLSRSRTNRKIDRRRAGMHSDCSAPIHSKSICYERTQ